MIGQKDTVIVTLRRIDTKLHPVQIMCDSIKLFYFNYLLREIKDMNKWHEICRKDM